MKKIARSLSDVLASFSAGLEKEAAEGGTLSPEELEAAQAAEAAKAAPPAAEPAPVPEAVDPAMAAAPEMDPAATPVEPVPDQGQAIDAAVADVADAATQSAEAVATLKDIAKTASAKGGESIIKSAEEFGRHFARSFAAELEEASTEDLSKEAEEHTTAVFNDAYIGTMLKLASEEAYALTLEKIAADVAAEPEEQVEPDESVEGKGEDASLSSVAGSPKQPRLKGEDVSLENVPGAVDELKKLTKNAYDMTLAAFSAE